MVALALAALAALRAPAGAREGALEVRDGALRDDRGREVVLHGVNVVVGRAPWIPAAGGSEERSFDSTDARRVRAMGLNAIRLGITWEGVMPAPGAVSQAYLDRVARTVRSARRAGLYVVVAMHQERFSSRFAGHGAPDWAVRDGGRVFDGALPFPFGGTEAPVGRAFTALWEDQDGLRGRYAEAWRAVAARLRGHARVVGYDLVEAPGCDVGAAPCGQPPGPPAAGRWLAPFYAALVPAVRGADETHPVLYREGWSFGAYKAYGDAGARPLYSDRGRPFASRVRTVAVPYPQRIAGREATWAFDRPDRRFTLRYRPRGGAETVVALPRAAFPDGARVSASGARTRREGGTGRVRARDGVRMVRVTVTGR